MSLWRELVQALAFMYGRGSKVHDGTFDELVRGGRRYLSWNYRLIQTNEEDYEIAEVYYDVEGEPKGYCLRNAGGSSLDEIESALFEMHRATTKPVLVAEVDDDGRTILTDTGKLLG